MVWSTAPGAGVTPLVNTGLIITPSSNGLTDYYDIGLACSFRFNDLSNSVPFASMFDAYKLGKITLNLEYLSNVASVNGAGLMPTSYMYWDQDDSVAPTAVNDITRRQGVKIRSFGNRSKTVHSYTFQPIAQLATQSTVVTPGLTPAILTDKPVWIDCTDLNVPHYALKVFLSDVYLPGGTAGNQAFRFMWKYNMAFRSPLDTF